MDRLHERFGIELGHPDSVFGLTLALRLRELEKRCPNALLLLRVYRYLFCLREEASSYRYVRR
jgi:hypothetical protein